MPKFIRMTLGELFQKRLIIVTGKGGVGKTTVALALAFLNAEHGRRSILAIIGQVQKGSPFFGSKKKIDFSEKRLDKGVYAIGIDPNKALREYIRLNFVAAFPLYAAVFKSKALQDFFEGAPGLKELITLGKVWHLGKLKTGGKNPRPKYDQVIFDAPSTGHALPLFNLPERVLSMVQKGAFRDHVQLVEGFLKDPEQTAFVTVTIPEEMAVKETLEIIEGAKEVGIKHAFTVVNCVYPEIFDKSEREKIRDIAERERTGEVMPLLALAQSHIKKVDESRGHIRELYEADAGELLFVNYRFKSELGLEDVANIGKELEEQLGG
ncbi:MAG TPA: ArsA family ATPase [Thermodesulfobacteriota bacterium]|nr:ArsA family ATPase [Thermodesulfobacteriota bacterium]